MEKWDIRLGGATLVIHSAEPIPLSEDEQETIRVGNTRVTLDIVIAAFQEGATPEEIVEQQQPHKNLRERLLSRQKLADFTTPSSCHPDRSEGSLVHASIREDR